MPDTPQPMDYVVKMIEAAQNSDNASDMPPLGTFAHEYAEAIKAEVNADNVQAFLFGAACVNLLVQEAILRATMVASDQGEAATEAALALYAEGCGDGARAVAQFLGVTIQGLIDSVIEGPAYERAFNGIVNQF
jgi:hypothetical protein